MGPPARDALSETGVRVAGCGGVRCRRESMVVDDRLGSSTTFQGRQVQVGDS